MSRGARKLQSSYRTYLCMSFCETRWYLIGKYVDGFVESQRGKSNGWSFVYN
ncbi:hypothetical protein BCR33DRAFT_109404 [Rhizoclosmatium globosum]|uniref:Uncharacterized protein n=1 Tax=Rhizoclosmatium globosum TaxID=329046 RepID=A0A1Y2CIB7_9FUNG|nr:hypothetical protein BCR33DRAFT_109404 [Rhizoclosmatium globosum]|eukprot:ORY46762.1 hypothetical protein BCR33DRAFT_109404 [Rhizoclosmatium globosum]